MSAIKVPAIFTAIDKFSRPLEKMTNSTRRFGKEAEKSIARIERRFRAVNQVAGKLSRGFAIGGLAIAAPLVLAGKHAVEFEDKMADVAKTTGLGGEALQKLGRGILDISTETRSSIDELQDIAVVGGQMGVVSSEMESFIVTADKFNVALGDDFAGGTKEAVASVSKLQSLFQETRKLDISASITKAGSVINALSATGKSTSQNITDFTLRIGALPDALKPSIQSTAALGAVLEEAAIDAEVGARAFGILITTAGKNLSKFSSQMNMTKKDAAALLEEDASKFASKFAESLKGLNTEQLSVRLKKLGLGATGVIKVVGALASNTDRLSELQKISNQEFKKGTSLLDEFNTKNTTMAAKLKIAQNNFKAISIMIGTELIPIVSELLKEFLPFVKKMSQWIKDNPKALKTILKLSVGLAGVMFVLAGLAKVTAIASFAMANFGVITAIATSPITLMVLAIVAVIAILIAAVVYWDEWTAAVERWGTELFSWKETLQWFEDSWGRITKGFNDGGIITAVKEIGLSLMSYIIAPIEFALKALASIPGLGSGLGINTKLGELRAKLEAGFVDPIPTDKDETPALNPKEAEQAALKETIENNNNTNATLTVLAPKGSTQLEQDDNFFPKITTSLLSAFN